MKESDSKPSLRISHIVYGRQHEKGRVKYLVDPDGAGLERAIPEEVVLRRWRRRRFPGFTFSGERLSSTIWRALPELFQSAPEKWAILSILNLKEIRESGAARLREKHYVLPSAETMSALFSICGSIRLRALVNRHANADRVGRSGVPDLFLFACDRNGKPVISRFVEVKKSEEPVSSDQLDEIRFLQNLGLHARVLRLIERDKQ
jgi:hypothetical protein